MAAASSGEAWRYEDTEPPSEDDVADPCDTVIDQLGVDHDDYSQVTDPGCSEVTALCTDNEDYEHCSEVTHYEDYDHINEVTVPSDDYDHVSEVTKYDPNYEHISEVTKYPSELPFDWDGEHDRCFQQRSAKLLAELQAEKLEKNKKTKDRRERKKLQRDAGSMPSGGQSQIASLTITDQRKRRSALLATRANWLEARQPGEEMPEWMRRKPCLPQLPPPPKKPRTDRRGSGGGFSGSSSTGATASAATSVPVKT